MHLFPTEKQAYSPLDLEADGRPLSDELTVRSPAKSRLRKAAIATLAVGAGLAVFLCMGAHNASGHSAIHPLQRRLVPHPKLSPDAKIFRNDKRQTADVCTTDACKKFADSVIAARAVNYTSIDPCVDPSQYVCGNWIATHDWRPEQSTVSVLSVMSDVNSAIVRGILEGPYPGSDGQEGEAAELDEENFDKMKDNFNACTDTTAINAKGGKPLQDLIAEFGNCNPKVKDPASKLSTGELSNAVIWLARYGVSALIQAFTTPDDRKPDVVVIGLSSGTYGLPSRQYYSNAAAVQNYTTAIVGMFDNLFGADNNAKHQDYAKLIIELENKTSNAEPNPAVAADVSYYYNPMDIAAADALLPEISFSQVLGAFIPEGYNLTSVIVYTPEYFPQLSTILKSTSTEALYAYFVWSLIAQWAPRISSEVNAPFRRLSNQLTGRNPDATPERWRTCQTDVDSNLPWIESAAYVKVAFTPEAKEFGDRIIDDLRAIYTEKLAQYDWMSASVKDRAIKKVANIFKKIGYPTESPNVLDPKAVHDFYASVTVTNTSFWDNGIAFNEFYIESNWNDLLKPTDRGHWFMTAPEVNAYYNPPTNEIGFPAGIMQTPIFNLDLPEYVSYGAFGAVAGHEITHGFDDSGSQYDETGAYNQWWDNATLNNFHEKAECFVNQFNQYQITGPDGAKVNVDGELTLGENIADSGGLSASFAAWQKRNTEKPNQLLPGLEEYTREQLFYISYGGLWCSKVRPAEKVRRIFSDPHSPPEWRIFGTLANQAAFKQAFNCPTKQPVCELW